MTTDAQPHADREHSELGASICKRWWHCPGSVALVRGLPNDSTPAALLGTAAHELAAICLESGQDAYEFHDRQMNGIDVDENMSSAVQVYLDHCRSRPGAGASFDAFRRLQPNNVMIEKRFNLAEFDPPAPMFGTADCAVYLPLTRTLCVDDYKHGVGMNVEAAENPQLKYYALGAVISLGAEQPVEKVVASIVQPRAPGRSAIKTVEYDADELAEWSIELISRAEATQAPDAPLVPGPWCNDSFCPARGTCKARAQYALETGGMEFDEIMIAPKPAPEVRLITPEQLGVLLHRLDALDDFSSAARAAAQAFINRGIDVPGWKLIPTQGRQAWLDKEAAAFDLEAEYGLAPADIMEKPELRSPAQIRGALVDRIVAAAKEHGDKITKKAAEAEARKLLAPLTHSPSSGLKLAPTADTTPAALVGGAEFDAIPDCTKDS